MEDKKLAMVREIADRNPGWTRRDLDAAFEMVGNGSDPMDALDELAINGYLARGLEECEGIDEEDIYELVTDYYYDDVAEMGNYDEDEEDG